MSKDQKSGKRVSHVTKKYLSPMAIKTGKMAKSPMYLSGGLPIPTAGNETDTLTEPLVASEMPKASPTKVGKSPMFATGESYEHPPVGIEN
ncbi:MAG: hypothetical protein AAGC85_02805 [Bacteroidota bacterium]